MPETNSSSSHSLAIFKNNPNKTQLTINLESDNSVMIPDYSRGDFGWGWDYILDPAMRACYVISCISNLYRGKKRDELREKFENIIKDYTGATKVKYEWAKDDNLLKIYEFAPSVDHQSIGDMYDKISISDDSMRDFIFSNQSYLLIGGEDIEPLDILLSNNPEAENKVKIIFYTGSTGIGKDLEIPFVGWPGGEKIRRKISDLCSYIYYSSKDNTFKLTLIYANYFFRDKDPREDEDYTEYNIVYEENIVKFYKRSSFSENCLPWERDFSGIEDYKELKFDVIRL